MLHSPDKLLRRSWLRSPITRQMFSHLYSRLPAALASDLRAVMCRPIARDTLISAYLPSPAAATPNARTAGTSTTVMSASARSRSAPAFRMTKIGGDRPAASVPAVTRGNACTGGSAATFDHACANFEAAWRVFLSKRTEADFQAWRDQEAWTAEKYRRFDRHERMPPDWKPPTPVAMMAQPIRGTAPALRLRPRCRRALAGKMRRADASP